ncbi:unnamed protein product [Nezara viridula]|uniref:T-complex protein 1 subunit delta n=1 Tax=Nezara viridula TaxID=85310 RepID=A0A9P0MV88_NEZVI|nr:unnamed protein product [Nezara viridula]CAH1408435.1 unnamed protein product [Nezara viridula]
MSIHSLLEFRRIDNTGSCKHAVFILNFPCCSLHSTFYYDDPEFPKEAKMKADGSFDKEKDKEAVEEMVKDEVLKAKLMAAIDECDVTAKADKCEAAYEFVKCKKAKVRRTTNPKKAKNVDLKDIKIIMKLGGTVEDTELIVGLVFTQKSANVIGPRRLEKAKIGLIQFCISPPEDMDHNVLISDYAAMDRILKEERAYILSIAKQIKKAVCTMLLTQKSVLRDALSDLAIHFFVKLKIMVVKDIERKDIDFVCKTLGCRPIPSLDHFTSEALVGAELAVEASAGSSRIVKVTGIHNPAKTVTILFRGSNNLVLEEADRSIHDALCVIRCLIRERALLPGGGAPKIELSLRLGQHAQLLGSEEAYCLREYAKALEIVPYALAENAGLNPVATVTELWNKNVHGQTSAGINVRKGQVTDILEENVLQPMLVTASAITLATETVSSILKIDDILNVAH